MSSSIFRRGLLAAILASATPLFASLPASAAEKVVFLISWLPGGDESIPYVGVSKGLFAAEGLDVTVQVGRGATEVVTKLATGAADIGEGGLAGLLQAKARGDVPVKALLSVFSKQPDAIFTTEGSGIRSLKDLTGRKVATATFTSSNVFWPLVLKNNDVDVSKVDLLKVDPGVLAPMLATGKVDATINWTTVGPLFEKALADSGRKLVVIPWSGFGFDGYGLSVFASEKMLKERPEVVRKFLRAYLKAAEMAVSDPKIAAASLKAIVPEVDLDVATKQFAATVPLTVNEISKKNGLGTFDKALLAKTWEWTAKSQNIPLDKLDPESVVDRSFAPM